MPEHLLVPEREPGPGLEPVLEPVLAPGPAAGPCQGCQGCQGSAAASVLDFVVVDLVAGEGLVVGQGQEFVAGELALTAVVAGAAAGAAVGVADAVVVAVVAVLVAVSDEEQARLDRAGCLRLTVVEEDLA